LRSQDSLHASKRLKGVHGTATSVPLCFHNTGNTNPALPGRRAARTPPHRPAGLQTARPACPSELRLLVPIFLKVIKEQGGLLRRAVLRRIALLRALQPGRTVRRRGCTTQGDRRQAPTVGRSWAAGTTVHTAAHLSPPFSYPSPYRSCYHMRSAWRRTHGVWIDSDAARAAVHLVARRARVILPVHLRELVDRDPLRTKSE
jgi:hypothetical protein